MSVRSAAVALLDVVFDRRVFTNVTPPGGLEFPYGGVIDGISDNPALKGDGRTLATKRLLQVDVYQLGDDEDDVWVDRARDAVDGAPVDGGFRFSWSSTARTYDQDSDVVHHALTFAVVRLTGYVPR